MKQKWVCTHCGVEGEVDYEEHTGVWAVVTAMRDDHARRSPACETDGCISVVTEAKHVLSDSETGEHEAQSVVERGASVDETFEALVKRQQETRVALETVEQGSLQHRILDDTLRSVNYALAQHAEEAVTEIARLREQADTLTAAVKPFAEVWQRYIEIAGTDVDFRDWLRRHTDYYIRYKYEAAANALADGGE